MKPVIQYAVLLDATDGSHELSALEAPEPLGPVDFAWRERSRGATCVGAGILAGGIVPGSNRLIFAGDSELWGGFYTSALGGAGLLWDGVGISFLAVRGRAARPSVVILAGEKNGFPSCRQVPLDLDKAWKEKDGEAGFYALQRHVFSNLWDRQGTPRVLAVGPAARTTRFGAVGSSRTAAGKLTAVDDWAGRGGFGSRLLQRHNICAIVYGGDFEDEDLTDRAEADGFFQKRFSKSMLLEDLEATTKYRFDPRWKSGGTFGVNYSSLQDSMLSFNYRSVSWGREQRRALWERLVRDHFLAQFNHETIEKKQFSHCGEPCPAVCKKMNGVFKKDYEPYHTLGPQLGVFDQRVAEKLNRRSDALGFDGIQVGGLIAWVMECLHQGVVSATAIGLPPDVPERPVFEPDRFDPARDSEHNGRIALALLDLCATPGHLLSRGMRQAARELGPQAAALAVYLANGPEGWMVPNQYWVPGMLAPMPIMGKYFTDYASDFRPPRELGRRCVERMLAEITTENAGVCRFHRGWSEKLWPELVNGHLGAAFDFAIIHAALCRAIRAQAKPVFWECRKIFEILAGYFTSLAEENPADEAIRTWHNRIIADPAAAARAYWDELAAGIDEGFSLLPGE
ncbi:MAG: aldehyde ferredoxin oxidoreductase [Myxococcales bacterium]|nr:aldehyde ferredoxin oxidoreductase [Myxococcales bacterium]